MKGKLRTTAIALLAIINVLSFVYITQSISKIDQLEKTVAAGTNKTVVYESKDGKTPVKGIDYFDGADGINAVSYSITTTVVKDIPLIGKEGQPGKDGKDGVDGINGQDAPIQEIQINTETGNLESKLSNQRTWSVLLECSQFRMDCSNG